MHEVQFVLCARCGDRIGMYEPVEADADGTRRVTSLVREPHLAAAGGRLSHVSCPGPAATAAAA